MFSAGDRVRVKESAFPGSDEQVDIRARGAIGTLISYQGDGLWLWRSDDGSETYPEENELEQVGETRLSP